MLLASPGWAAAGEPRSIDATLGGLKTIGLERTQRPAVAEVVEAYARALDRIQLRLQAGDLPRSEAIRQAGLAYQHLEHRLADILKPEQFQRFKALGDQSRPAGSRSRQGR